MSFTRHKNKIVYEKVLVVKSIHNSKEALKKSVEITDKISRVRLLNRIFGFIFVI